ncbi:MAG: non-homologous end-joining DNA ligase, partial [Acidobacteriota bacterium]
MFVAKDLRPMLATLPSSPPSLKEPGYVYEPKVDGIRAIVEVLPGSPPSVRFWSRNGNDKTAQFPDIVEAIAAWLKKIKAAVVLDGEIVALDEEGRPAGFQKLQHRIHITVPGFNSKKKILPPSEAPAAFVAFDLLRDGDDDLRSLMLTERRARLEALFKKHKPPASTLVRITEQAIGDGHALMKKAIAENWEGLMVKLARSPYRTAKRSPEWIKHKLNKQDEFVVCGWTDPGGTRVHFGSLILGAHDSTPQDGGKLRYAGEVGTGFTGAELERVMKLLTRIETPTCPLDPKPKILSAKGAPHWVRPILVAQVRYTEITDDGRLRHPAYLGLRGDKSASAVMVPAVPKGSTSSKGQVLKAVPKVQKISANDIDGLVEQLDFLEKARKNGRLKLPGGDTLEVTNLHKIFWPAVK